MKPAKHLLVVEDDAATRETLRKSLEETGYHVSAFSDGTDAGDALERDRFDLAIIDLLLADIHGLTLMRTARQAQGRMPIIVLTARPTLEDRIAALDSGADDYIAKPFEMRELEARIRVLLRPLLEPEVARQTRIGPLELTRGEPWVRLNGVFLKLPRSELSLLEALTARPGRPVRKEVIGWKLPGKPSPAGIQVCVYRLRRRLAPHGLKIRTLRGFGYLLVLEAPT